MNLLPHSFNIKQGSQLLGRKAMSIIICVSSATELLFSKQQLTLSKRSKFTRSTWISSFERLKLQRKRKRGIVKDVNNLFIYY